jgi:hypothetical protein
MKLLRNFKLSRRTALRGLLGGAAVSVGLPPLEAMLNTHGDAHADGTSMPLRFISFMWGAGVQLAQWEPQNTGVDDDWALSPQLEPFDDLKESLIVLTGLRNHFGGNAISHHEGMCVFNGYDFVPRPDLPGFASDWGGPTIDQVIADAIAVHTTTPVRSLQIGGTKFDSPADNGATAKAISARGEPGSLTTLYPDPNPQSVWQSLFGEFVQPKDNRQVRLSILDAIAEDTARLRTELGVKDNQRLDAHLQGVTELEQKIAALPPICDIPSEEDITNGEANGAEMLNAQHDAMAGLIANAFLCDTTRVVSDMFSSVATEVIFGEIGHFSTQHGDSHAGDNNYHEGIVYCMEKIAAIMRVLRDTMDIEGTSLLDSTILFASTEVSQGWSHSWQRLPILVGGSGRGYLRTNQHYRAVAQQGPNDDQTSSGNTSDVLLALLQAFDPAAESIGAGAPMSDSPLAEIIA